MNGNQWVRWIHEGTGFADTQAEKDLRMIWETVSGKKHCAKCMNMSGCCFPRNNMPEYPLHPNCHCKIEPIAGICAITKCPKEKLEKYIFDPISNCGKKDLFESWGYAKIDSTWVQ